MRLLRARSSLSRERCEDPGLTLGQVQRNDLRVQLRRVRVVLGDQRREVQGLAQRVGQLSG
jgi:hypothetical protein